MKNDERIETYLAAATAGLRDDREVQLDVQAELRSHVEERLADASAGPPGGGADAVADVLANLGPVTAVAGELAEANQARMKVRAQLRLIGRWLLVPLAVVAALYTIDLTPLVAVRALNAVSGSGSLAPLWLNSWTPTHWFGRRYTPEQELILHGDRTRQTAAEQQKAIWDKCPENKVYFHNYLSHLMCGGPEDKTGELGPALTAAITAGRKLDPDNAQFDYIVAARLLKAGATIDSKQTGKDKAGKPIQTLSWEIKDRAKLDQAMVLFREGLAKPEFRRYAREMLCERLRIMGPPNGVLDNIDQITVAAGVLLPDLSNLRSLARASVLYAKLLIDEGRPAEAEPFLRACQALALQLNADSFTLIDVLVSSAIIEIGLKETPELWVKAGKPEQAEIARRNGEILGQPVRTWRDRRKVADSDPNARKQEQTLKRHGSIMAGLLLPALGPEEMPKVEDYGPGRLLEYTMVERFVLSLTAALLLAGMIGCALIYLRWRVTAEGGSIPLLLVPGWCESCRILGLGVVLPLFAYYLYSRWFPFNGREYSLAVGLGRLCAESSVLLSLVIGGTTHLAARAVRRRSREVGVTVPAGRNSWWVFWSGTMALLLVTGIVSGVLTHRGRPAGEAAAGGIACLILLGALALFTLYRFLVSLFDSHVFGFYRGSLARTLIPFLALAIVLLSLLAKPYLTWSERYLVRHDPLMALDGERGGFTAVESRLVQRLLAEMNQAAKELGKP